MIVELLRIHLGSRFSNLRSHSREAARGRASHPEVRTALLDSHCLACESASCRGSWWRIWLLRDVEWTPTAFFAVLSFPAVFYLRAVVLLGDDPRAVTVWRDHFYATRRAFFMLQVIGSINFPISNWIITGISPDRQLIFVGVVGSVSAAVAVLSASPRIHGFIAVMMLLIFAYAPYAPR